MFEMVCERSTCFTRVSVSSLCVYLYCMHSALSFTLSSLNICVYFLVMCFNFSFLVSETREFLSTLNFSRQWFIVRLHRVRTR